MSTHVPGKGRQRMRAYAEEILDAIKALGTEHKAPKEKVDQLRDMLEAAAKEEAKNVLLTNQSVAATAKTKAIHGTAEGQSVSEPGSLKYAINNLYNYLKNEIGKNKMLLRDYGFHMQHKTVIGIDEDGVSRKEEGTTDVGASKNQQTAPDEDGDAQPKED